MSDKEKTLLMPFGPVTIGKTVELRGKSTRNVTILNITPNWVIFTDLTDGKRKDCTVDAFKKNASKIVVLNIDEVIADAGPIEDKPSVEIPELNPDKPVFGINIHKSGSDATPIDEWSTQGDKVPGVHKPKDPEMHQGMKTVTRLRSYGLKRDNQVYTDANGKQHVFTDKQHFIICTLAEKVGFMSPTEIGKLYGQSLYAKSNDPKDLKMASSAVSKSCIALTEKGLLVRSDKGHYKIGWK